MSRPPVVRPDYVAQMFGAIADRYDLMNRIMTFGRDGRWRRQAADVAALEPGMRALDVATGTGDLAFELARRVDPGGHLVGIDFAKPMLDRAEEKAAGLGLPVTFQLGDALSTGFHDSSFDAVSCAFGLRNMERRIEALQEWTRVVRPARRVVILELTPPANQLARRYMDEVIPRLGELIAGAREAYTYLPESVHDFPDAVQLGHMMQRAGLRQVKYRLLNFGTIALHWGIKPP